MFNKRVHLLVEKRNFDIIDITSYLGVGYRL